MVPHINQKRPCDGNALYGFMYEIHRLRHRQISQRAVKLACLCKYNPKTATGLLLHINYGSRFAIDVFGKSVHTHNISIGLCS